MNKIRGVKLNPVGSLSISIVSKGQILGLEDTLNGRRYTTSVKCITKGGSIFKIGKEEFFKIIQKDTKSIKYIEMFKQVMDQNTMGKVKLAKKVYSSFQDAATHELE